MAKTGKRGRKRTQAQRHARPGAKKRAPRKRRMRRVQRRKRLTLHTLRRARRWRRLTAVLLVVGGCVLGGLITFYVGLSWFQERPAPALGGDPPVAVSWPEGLDAGEAAELLADLGLTDYPSAMEIYFRAMGVHLCAQAGPHLLPRGATPQALVAALCRTDARPEVKVTIPEGFNRFTIAKRLENNGICQRDAFEHASADDALLYELGIEPAEVPAANTAEGFLFPATYVFHVDSDPREVVRRLVRESNRRWTALVTKHAGGWERLQSEFEMTRRDVINLAAMVEKEAAVADERPVIASVFLNRLRHRDYPHLQSDPTAMYGCMVMPDEIPACDDWNGRASGALNRDDKNVFSTYVTRGLPPGPIANPGAASVEAVLAPADTGFYFFVAKGKGRHEFTKSYDEHLEAVKRLRERK
jgi:UPF0755 protein